MTDDRKDMELRIISTLEMILMENRALYAEVSELREQNAKMQDILLRRFQVTRYRAHSVLSDETFAVRAGAYDTARHTVMAKLTRELARGLISNKQVKIDETKEAIPGGGVRIVMTGTVQTISPD